MREFDYWNPVESHPGDENEREGNGVPGMDLNMEGMFPQGFRTRAEMDAALGKKNSGTQSDVAWHVGMAETSPVEFKELPPMPTPEAVEAGLEVLLAEGGATFLCEADPENGQYFSTIELDFSTMSSDERAAIAMNPFVRSLGISREKTFRGTGEGTGDVDWNDIDCDVRQTVTWDPEAKMIVAGSRMAVPAETIDQETFFKSLYEYNEEFENEVIKKYFELGRTFLNDEYGHFLRAEKKSGKPGADALVAAKGKAVRTAVFQGVWLQVQKLKQDPKNKDIKGLMGGVSIDGRYTDEALQRIVSLITQRFPMEAVLPEGAHFEPRQEMEPVEAGAFSNDENWNTTADFGKAMKQLKRFIGKMTVGDKAIFPRLLETYAGFVDESTAVGFGQAVKNLSRRDADGRPCVELALFLDLEHVSESTEKDHAPQGKALQWNDSLRCKFGGTAWEEKTA